MKIIKMIVLVIVLGLPHLTYATIHEVVSEDKTQQLITISFQDIKVRAALQLLAKFADMNIMVSDKVDGTMALQLDKVPWQQALDLILQTQGLAKRQFGNVLLIAPIDILATHEQQALKAEEMLQSMGPLQTSLLQIKYGKAADLANTLKDKNNSLLSTRGAVSVDARTNTLWVQDIPAKIGEIKQLIQALDIPVKQVLIEARIVNLDSSYERNLGIHFGMRKDNGDTPATKNNNEPGLHFDTPVPVTNNNALGIAVIKLGSGFLLDLELAALESEGAGEIISAPHLITANEQTAEIQSGEEIPYQESAGSGATSTSFKKAVLSLAVTPQITPDNKILLSLKLNQDKLGAQWVNQVPTINTRELQTQVLINNGQTIVLGGIYEQTKNKQIDRVPFLNQLPLLGKLFQHQHNLNIKTELLIFVTPKIIQDDLR